MTMDMIDYAVDFLSEGDYDLPVIGILRGLPGSGKSSFARQCVLNGSLFSVIVSRDSFRDSLYQTREGLSNAQENLITKLVNKTVVAALDAGFNVLVDATNLKAKYVRDLAKLSTGGAVVAYTMTTPLDVCIENDKLRERTVGEAVIRDMYSRFFQKGKLASVDIAQDAVHKQLPYVFDPLSPLPRAVIVDIDGTIAHNDGKRSFYDYSKVLGDEPIEDVIDIIHSLSLAGFQPVFVTGRDDSCRELTRQWLAEKFSLKAATWPLYMRKTGDERKDRIIKDEIFEQEIAGRYSVVAVFDDRQAVCEMWQEKGLKVFRCGKIGEDNF